MVYEEYTDEELMQMAGTSPGVGGASDYSDEELMKIAGTKPPSGATRSWEDERPLSFARLKEDLVKRGIGIEKTLSAPEDESLYRSFSKAPGRILDVAGDIAGFGVDIGMQGIEHAYKKIFDPESKEIIQEWGRELLAAPPVSAEESLGESFAYVPGRTIKTLGEAYGGLKERYPEGIKHAEAITNIAIVAPFTKFLAKGYAASKLAPELLDQKLSNVVTKGIEKGIRPSVGSTKTAGMTKQYFTNAKDAVKSIVENKNSLVLMDEIGEKITGRLPENLKQFSEAIAQTKGNIFKEYNKMAVKADAAQVTVDLTPISEELNIIAKSKILNDLAPDVAKYAQSRAENIIARGTYTTTEAQEAISVLNNSLGAFYKNPSYETASKAYVDSLVVNNLRKSLDNVIENTVGRGYQELKKSYGALKTIERDVNRRATVDARKNLKGLLDFSDVFSGAYAVHGIITMNPAVLGAAGAAKATVRLYNWLNNPNRIIKSMFSDAEKILNKGRKPRGPIGPAEGPPPIPEDVIPPRPNLSGPLSAPETAAPGIVPEIPPRPPPPAEIVQPGATSGGKQPVSVGKGPQNLITYIQKNGFIRLGEYSDKTGDAWSRAHGFRSKDRAREIGDMAVVSRQNGKWSMDEMAENLNAEGISHPSGGAWTAENLNDVLSTKGQGRKIFTADKQDVMIDRQLRREENAWIERQLADLDEQTRIDALAGENKGSIERISLDEITAEAGLSPEELGYTKADVEDFFGNVHKIKEGAPEEWARRGKPSEVTTAGRVYEPEPPAQFERISHEGLGPEPYSAPFPKNGDAIAALVPDKPWEWTADDLMDIRPSERLAKLEKIWGPAEEFDIWFEGKGVDKRRYWPQYDSAADLEYAIKSGDKREVADILSDIQSRLLPQDYYAYEKIQNPRGNAPIPRDAGETISGEVSSARRTGTSATARYNQESLPGLSYRESFSLTNPETEIGRGVISKKDMTPTQGMTFREAQDLFKRNK